MQCLPLTVTALVILTAVTGDPAAPQFYDGDLLEPINNEPLSSKNPMNGLKTVKPPRKSGGISLKDFDMFSPMDSQRDDASLKQSAKGTSFKRNFGLGEQVERVFNAGSDPAWSGIKTSSLKVSSVKTGSLTFKGGCKDRPASPANALVKCSQYSGCTITCLEDHELPDQQRKMNLVCESGAWIMPDPKWDTIPDCQPICDPPCQNLGFCLAPNVCNCPDNFEGPQCQTPKTKPCLDKPPVPMNSRVSCSVKECFASCNAGFQFPGGQRKMFMDCDAGTWVPRQQQFSRIPDCQPICTPPCENGGRCLPGNLCECPQKFRGPQCNYPEENCNPDRMNFNGVYNCSGRSDTFSCSLSCGVHGTFDSTPAPIYTCQYATAAFTPQPIPLCIFEDGQTFLFKSNSSSHTRTEFHSGSSFELSQWSSTSDQQLQHFGGRGQKKLSGSEQFFQNFWSSENSGDYSINSHEYSLIREMSPIPGTCMAWGAGHYKTFDGKVYSFQSSCSYILLRDVVAGMFTIMYRTKGACGAGSTCKRSITVLVEDDVYHLDTRDDGQPTLQRADYSVAIPGSVDGMVAERVSNYVVLRADGFGFTVKWDTKSTVMIDVSEALWNRTAGLCGRINGFWMDDFENRDGSKSSSLLGFVNSWEADGLTEAEKCLDGPSEHHPCKYDQADDQVVTDQATEMCDRLLNDPKFEECRKVMDPRPYYETCRWDYCQCQKDDRRECACSALERFFHECIRLGVDLADGWRDATLCPVDCHDGRVYSMCGPASDDTCHSVSETTKAAFCVEGCYCPKGSALHDGNCISRSQCPCTLRKKLYQPGEQVPNDCNTCTCVAGEWQCTELRCGARCAARGDPHYTTFDGRHYDFMGKCSYFLVKGDNYSISAENVACSGAISEAMSFPTSAVSGLPSCTKSVTIRVNDDVIKLKQNRDVLVNGDEIATVPFWMDGIYIRHASSVFVSVELPNGLEVWWDGQSRVYIDATPEFYGKTQGLCGTFNENQRDDLTTPEGDVEQSVMAFANKWKTREVCQDVSLLEPNHPCQVNAHNRAEAEKYCQPIRGELFEKCHNVVDYDQYYKDCLYDVCACQGKLGDCLCPAIASYAKECTARGVIIDWLPEIRHCGLHCTGGQVYQSCGNSCSRSCYDIATYSKCRQKCVEGCNCPEGLALDDSGHCIPIHQCPCIHKNVEFKAGFTELRPGIRTPDLCTCINGRWSCRPATQQEQEEHTLATTPDVQCRQDNNEEFTSCEPDTPISCKNMNGERPTKSSTNCRPGCQCKKGYVLDAIRQTCIKPSECPCHHGGRSYGEGEQMAQDCNSCTCHSGKWMCTTHVCAGLCSNWGESHYKTFDGRVYDFHGNCDYMLAKGGSSDPDDRFQISAQSVPCGSSGVACSKSLTLQVGGPDSQEMISLTRHRKISMGQYSQRILVRQAGVFVFIEVADLGLVLQWDHGTRVYLRLDPKWKGRVRGLCGNFNDNELDDFQPPTGGLTEISAKVFGDSWRLQTNCPESLDYVDTCTTHPHRKVWAVRNCNILKSDLFEKCHSEVPVADYIDRCVLDTCGCDMGGDCECLCTAFAAYAHECNLRGIAIKWRSQQLCPMQCDEECSSYTPCMTTCPAVTCDNPFGITQLCKSDSCVEGCQPRSCPPGHIHRSAKDTSCMPTANCKAAICLVVDGVVYAEGDVMERDGCHACYCSKGKKVCQGQPCLVITPATTPLPPTTTGRLSTCRTGWSDWFNSHQPQSDADLFDVEPLPQDWLVISATSAMCDPSMMVAIECRTVGGHISHKKTGDVVECNLSSGLRCTPGGIKGRNVCHDYEIRVLCNCGETPTVPPVIETTTEAAPPPATPAPIVPVDCLDGWTPWFNGHAPDSRGEYELTSMLRKTHSFCAAHQMTDVECRPTDPYAPSDDISGQPSCTKEGYRCRNPRPSTCTDHEIRFRCLCRCQDGLEVEAPIRQMTASSFLNAQSRPENGLLASNKFWSPRRPYQTHSEWLQVDLLVNKEITGLMLQGNARTDEWITSFTVQYSTDTLWWSSVMEAESFVPLVFPGNEDGHSVKRVLFPDSFFARYIRIVAVDFHQGISLRLQLLGCDVTTQPEPVVTVPTPLRCDPARPVKEHPTNCSMYYVCRELVHGTEDVERFCNPPTLFNPSTMVCDWPDSVIAIRPECGMAPPPPAPILSTPASCVDGWTDWFNTSHPAEGGGDFELYDTVAAAHSICPKTHIYDIECKFYTNKGSGLPVLDDFRNSPDALVSCKPTYGLICYNSNQESGMCQDYAVRFLCGCQAKPTTRPPFRPPTTTRKGLTTPPTTEECPWEMEWQSCAYRCNQLCLEYKSVLQQRGYCSSSDDCAPGCVDVSSPCPAGFFWRDQRTCVSIHDCTCRSWNGQIVPPGQVVDESHCETCQCVDNEYVCDTSSCFAYTTPASEAVQNVSLVTTKKAKTPGPVVVPTACSYWSDWFNDNRPKAGGEKEFKSLDELQLLGFCLEGQITEIECRDAVRDGSHAESGDSDVICSLESGLSCLQSRQGKGGRCKDYKIRYFCDCITPTEATTTTIMIWAPTPAQQLLCDESKLMSLLEDPESVPDSAFVATSSANPRLGPSSARLSSESLVSWVPARNNADQYVQVDLGYPQLVYGIILTGSPLAPEYVTSFFVLHSLNNERFSYVSDQTDKPMLFYGPLEHSASRRSIFYNPVEARFIRLEPQTWKQRIALQFDVLGCGQTSTPAPPTVPVPTVPVPTCADQMGMENGLISDQQISVSSGSRDGIRLGSTESWIPVLNSRREHVRVDFLEPRNLSGIVTQGHGHRQMWVEAYSVRYSSDAQIWSEVLDRDGIRRIFAANIDNQSPHINNFDRLINARYLEIIPWQWHNGIALRLDVLGCYVPVSVTPPPIRIQTITPPPEHCNLCPNVPLELQNLDSCGCPPDRLWDGNECVKSAQCPCFEGLVRYAVGSVHQSQECSICVCSLGGIIQCRRSTCPPCAPGLRSVLSDPPSCKCQCEECPDETRLCPSSNMCLDSALWCNGVEDCPDDERDCLTTTTSAPICVQVSCSFGYTSNFTGLVDSKGCPVINCVPEKVDDACKKPECPFGYTVEYQDDDDQQSFQSFFQLFQVNQCPKYSCVPLPTSPPPAPLDEVYIEDKCSMTGRLFETFDGAEYSYDICNHVLARDTNGSWSVTVHKNCIDSKTCVRSLKIIHGVHSLELLANLQVLYNNFTYSPAQAEKIASSLSAFSLVIVGDSLLFRSKDSDFWVLWDVNMNVAMGVSRKLVTRVDGLCGFYNRDVYDDKRTPSGQLAASTQEFGDSWSTGPDVCQVTDCPIQVQKLAWEKCSFLKASPFDKCSTSPSRSIGRCVEIMCDCMRLQQPTECDESLGPAAMAECQQQATADDLSECGCKTMTTMASECRNQNPSVDLTGWRTKYDCLVDCPNGAVYKECNKRACEVTCTNKKDPNACPEIPDLCIPGCVCPDGLVRKYDKCVKPNECRDCVCDGFGDPQYFSFDRQNFTFNGNCTYIAARDKLVNGQGESSSHDFQVLVTNKECASAPTTTCTEAVTVLYQDHVIEIQRSEAAKTVIATVDGRRVDKFPLHLPWMRMEKLTGEQVTVLLIAIQVEVSYFFHNFAFSVRVPSQLYLNKTEGLCGNCNGNSGDDLCKPDGQLTEDVNEFGLSWLVKNLLQDSPQKDEESCQVQPQPECIPPPPEDDLCLKLVDDSTFKMCNAVVDPASHLSACQYDQCYSANATTASCNAMEAYARECAKFGVCLAWRSDQLCPIQCPGGMEYRQCGSGCVTTCQNFKEESCVMSTIDGCYCPEGQAFNEALGRCVPTTQCVPCDANGHYPGDSWSEDGCTSCTCDVQGRVLCSTKQCVLESCKLGEKQIVQDPPEGECCPSVFCSPDQLLECSNVSTPICGPNQHLKFQELYGCLRQVCECVPLSECPSSVHSDPLIGEKYVLNETGCCPHWTRICVPEECPAKPECPTFYDLTGVPGTEGNCCPEFQCTPPKDGCVYELSDGEVKKFAVSDTWSDGPCTHCRCDVDTFTSDPRPLCALQSCTPTTSTDYVLRPERLPNKCCPNYIRTACKQGDHEYQVGEKWPSPDGDPCKSYECQQTTETIVKELQVQSCVTTCSEGWQYTESNSTAECCGSCHQVACVTAEGLHSLDETWSPDLCTKSVCVMRDGRLQVESTREECLEPSQEDLQLYVFDKTQPDDRCCPVYRKSACLVNGRPRTAGDQWPSDDPCVTFTCIEEADGQVSHQKIINACPPPTCEPGYEYEPPAPGSSECCGKCVQVTCVVDGEIHEVGSYWQPDPCTTVFCEGTRGLVFVSRTEQQCLNVSTCPADRLEHPPGECCAICKIDPTKVSCQPEPKPLQETIGYIVHHSTLYGRCVNQEPIRGLTECVGLCQSGTYHEHDSATPSNRCDCCHAESSKELVVPLKCDNGRNWQQRIRVATSCSCQPCSGPEELEQQTTNVKASGPSARILRGDGIIPRG